MKTILLIIIGLLGGVIGGMGMGGGTLLIPLLTIFAGMEQHAAQALNLIAFVPMSVVALGIHIKNKLVDFKTVRTEAVGDFRQSGLTKHFNTFTKLCNMCRNPFYLQKTLYFFHCLL